MSEDDTQFEWTVRFPKVNDGDPFEVRPVEMSLKREKGKFDYAQVKLPYEVGEMMKPHTKSGALRQQQPVELCLNGEVIHTLLFKPDAVFYNNTYTDLRLHDLQKCLDSGMVDKQWDRVSLQDAYDYIFEKRQEYAQDILKDIKYTVPDDIETVLIGEDSLSGGATGYARAARERQIEQSETQELVDGTYAVDIEQISPAKAIWKLNKKFGVTTWVDSNRNLWVGHQEAAGKVHLSAPDDKRVWRHGNVNITHPRSPVKTVVVEGSWVDKSGLELNPLDWFDKGGTGDVKATGFASRTDIDHGQTFKINNTNAKKDVVDTVAKNHLRKKMKEANSGSVEIDPALSGFELTHPKDVRIGDFLNVVPDDRYWDVHGPRTGEIGESPSEHRDHGYNYNEVYVINGIEHEVTEGGKWVVNLDVGMYPDEPMESFVRYFDPQSEEYLSEDKVFNGDWFEEI